MKWEPQEGGALLVRSEGDGPVLRDAQSALDLIGNAWQQGDAKKLILYKEDVAEPFFELRTGLLGEALQKFVNYGFRLAIVGDFSGYDSRSLRDFIYESNQGKVVYFADTLEDAVAKLAR